MPLGCQATSSYWYSHNLLLNWFSNRICFCPHWNNICRNMRRRRQSLLCCLVTCCPVSFLYKRDTSQSKLLRADFTSIARDPIIKIINPKATEYIDYKNHHHLMLIKHGAQLDTFYSMTCIQNVSSSLTQNADI